VGGARRPALGQAHEDNAPRLRGARRQVVGHDQSPALEIGSNRRVGEEARRYLSTRVDGVGRKPKDPPPAVGEIEDPNRPPDDDDGAFALQRFEFGARRDGPRSKRPSGLGIPGSQAATL
jgi:hypothetical protein